MKQFPGPKTLSLILRVQFIRNESIPKYLKSIILLHATEVGSPAKNSSQEASAHKWVNIVKIMITVTTQVNDQAKWRHW